MSIDFDNLSLFQPAQFKLTIDKVRYKYAEMFCKTVYHPGANVGAAIAPDKRVNVPMPGDTLTYGELSVTILLDEDWNSYKEIYNWLLRHVNNRHTTQYESHRTGEIPSISDITITALTNHNNGNVKMRYIDAFPTSVGDVSFEAGSLATDVVFPVNFAFAYFEID